MLELLQIIALFFSSETRDLAEATRAKAPRYLTPEAALTHAVAAKMAETPEVPAELLLSMAYSESRYIPEATSRVENGVRTTGIPKWSSPPKNVSGPYFCGITQAIAQMSWKRCTELRNIFVAYRTSAIELRKWVRDPHCRKADDQLRCALLGYGGGYAAIKAQTSTYPSRVLGRAHALKRATAPAT